MSTSSAYTREEIRAAVEEADRAGTYTAAHAHGGPGLRLAVEEGVGTIEHGSLADDEDIALMVERRTWLICTFGSSCTQRHRAAATAGARPSWTRCVAAAPVDESFPRHLASGVRFACGTDSHARLHAVRAADAGALGVRRPGRAARRHPLGRRGLSRRRRGGHLEVGKRADIIALDGDPLKDMARWIA